MNLLALLAGGTPTPPATPRTGYEVHGGRTTDAEEAALWATLAADTALTVTTAGTSAQGRPIRTVSLGAGASRTMLLVFCRHGYETGPREGALSWMRDLACSTDPDVLAYLAHHRVAMIPVLNPDAFAEDVEGPKGLTSTGVDLNSGDDFRMYGVENRVFAQVWADTAPSVHVDAHGFGSPSPTPVAGETFGAWSGIVIDNAHPDIRALTAPNGPGRAMADAVAATGQPIAHYTSPARPGYADADGSLNHAVSITTELNAGKSPAAKHAAMLAALNGLRAWHATNGAAAAAARDASMAAPSASGFVPSYWSNATGNLTTIPGLLGYTIPSALPVWQQLLWGIQPPVDGFVTIAQPAGLILPQLLDPDSALRLYSGAATRVVA